MFSTPSEYINYYVNILKNEYDLNDLKIDYHGFVGFMMNLFGWTNFDVKQYYDYLFKEGFLATAEEDNNLYLHGSRVNYPFEFAKPAKAYGNLIFDFTKVAPRSSNVYKREVILSTPFQISVNDFSFITDTKYIFVEEFDGNKTIYYCLIFLKNERQKVISSFSPKITVPFYNFEQYEIKEYQYNAPNYPYGTYSSYSISLSPKDQIADISVKVRKAGASNYEDFYIKNIKAFETPISKAVFLNRVSDKIVNIELGNGYYGEWIPNSTVLITLKTTNGLAGNSLKKTQGSYKGTLLINHYDSQNNLITNASMPFIGGISNTFIIDFSSSIDGKDVLRGSELRNDIVNWTETRNNLINQKDFYNVFTNFNIDYSVFFKKSHLIDNNIYVQKALRDQYKNIIPTTNYTHKCIDYDNPNLIKNLKSDVQYNVTSQLSVSTRYTYKIVACGIFHESLPSNSISVELSSSQRSIVLTWDPVENAEYYKIYGRTGSYDQYWIVNKTNLDSNGKVYFEDLGLNGTSEKIKNSYLVKTQVNFPEFQKKIEKRFSNFIVNEQNQYYIIDYNILREPDLVQYNKTVYLTRVPSISSLEKNSWTFFNNKIYLKLDEFYNETKEIVLIWTNNISLKSPFIYKYNQFFDWFEGYYLRDNIITYPIINSIEDSYSVPVFYLNLVYDYQNDITNIYIKSHQDISQLTFSIMVNNYDDSFKSIQYNNDERCFKHVVSGFISQETKIIMEAYQNNSQVFTCETPAFQQVYSVADQLVIPTYFDENDNKYLCNFPVIDSETQTDSDYLNSQVFDFVVNSGLNKNRMQSDTIQTRFLNTIYCEKSVVNRILKQNYDFDVIFPLNINISIIYNNKEEDFVQQKDDIELMIAKYLQENATGVNIKFYNSKIVDLIHDFNENILSVTVNVYDQNNNFLNDGIETVSRNQIFSNISDKLKIIEYTDVFWWWNINSININFS